MLDEILRRAGAECDAAECHGAITGLICSEPGVGLQPWLNQIMAELDPDSVHVAECRTALLNLYQACRAELASDLLIFAPMLPDDDESISVRASALGRWCQSFLFGLSLGGLPELPRMPDQVSEVISDLSELTRAGVDECENEDDNEGAYAELIEFIRVSVQLVFEELNPIIECEEPTPTVH